MSIPVTAAFLAAQQADGNAPVSKVQLVLGNYFSSSAYGTTVASSGDVSASYPAAGAIDGDRTEINIGPASGADNDIGLSSWRSSGIPDNGDTVTLIMTMSESRTLNRIKLYHLNAAGLKTYKLSYWDGFTYIDFAATSDIATGDDVVIDTTMQLDIIDFDDIDTTKIKLTITATEVAMDKANVVEIEAYRLVDITDRVKGVNIQRQRDFKLGNPLATVVSLDCINNDRFFSISHVPTDQEVEDGFINSQLQPGVGIIVSMGFDTFSGTPEVVSLLVATIDRITIRPKSRDAVIEGRDGMKSLINKIDSSKLKSSQDIGTNIQYVLNRANISSYEMSIGLTSINIDYFFSDQQDQLSTIQDLVQAAGDAIFYFDEYGIATFKFFTSQVTVQHVYTSQIDWEAGTLVDIDTTSVPGEMLYLYDQAQTWNNATAGWTTTTFEGTPTFTADGSGTLITAPANPGASPRQVMTASRAQTKTVGDWQTTFRENAGSNSAKFAIQFGFMIGSVSASTNMLRSGYWVQIDSTGPLDNTNMTVSIRKANASGVGGTIAASGVMARNKGTDHVLRVRRSPTGQMSVYLDGTLVCSVVDTDFTTSNLITYGCFESSGSTTSNIVHFLTDTLFTQTTTDGVGTWVSAALDTGVSVSSFNNLTSTQVLDSGTIAYYTASSDDNVTYDSFVAVSGNGQINSVVRRYIKTKSVLTLAGSGATPAVLDITLNWTVGAGSPKYPPAPSSFTFAFDSTLLDVQQELADNLGGDSAILNDVTVQAQPLVLTGTNADVVFQGTVGTPPSAISGSTPLAVTNGDVITLSPYIPGGMDISRMSGASPAAAAITFAGGAAGSWVFSSIHPTLPVLVITITGTGNITNLQIQGKQFAAATYLQAQNAKDAASIATYGDRRLSISNQWIVSTSVAASIASTIVANSSSPTSYIPAFDVRPSFAAQLGDRVTVEDENLDLSADYIIVGLNHVFASQGGNADVRTRGTLIKVPAGL